MLGCLTRLVDVVVRTKPNSARNSSKTVTARHHANNGQVSRITADKRGRPTPFATSYMVCRALKNNAATGYQGPVKIELLKFAGLLDKRAGEKDKEVQASN